MSEKKYQLLSFLISAGITLILLGTCAGLVLIIWREITELVLARP
jgi:hypothetical protein